MNTQKLKGTKTEANLATAFAGESQARNKYTYYASKARKEGFEVIARVFEKTSDQEKEHAKLWYKHMDGIGTTLENLLSAAAGEHEEWTEMYKNFAKEAADEGFDALAKQFTEIAAIEKLHEDRYRKLHDELDKGTLFSRGTPVMWECLNCGNQVKSADAPELCSACFHPRGYFERLENNSI